VIKIIAYLRRNPALTPQEFRDYWTNVHVPLIKSKLPSLRHYAGCFPLPVPGRTLDAPEFLTPQRQSSSAHLMDETFTRSVVVEVVDVL
jgi:hypothetical protein